MTSRQSTRRQRAISVNRLVVVVAASLALVAGLLGVPDTGRGKVGAPVAEAQSLAGDIPATPIDVSPERLAAMANGDVLWARPAWMFVFQDYETTEVAFRSTDSHGKPIVASTTIVRPHDARPDAPLMSYQHYVNGLSPNCQPSHTLQNPTLETVQDSAILITRLALMRGWAVAIPDHLGPNAAYTAARMGGQITLDGIRAAQRVPRLQLARSKSAMIGYSGGGLTTAWAAALAPDYAPELDIVGAAQGGVPADMTTMAYELGGAPHPAFGLAFAAALGLEREYPDLVNISPRLTDAGRYLLSRTEGACTAGLLFSGFMFSLPLVAHGAMTIHNETGLLEAMRINSIKHYEPVPDMPIYWWHSQTDPLVPYWDSEQTAARYCDQGVEIEWAPAFSLEHLAAAVEKVPHAVQWLEGRFAGEPAPVICPRDAVGWGFS